jgi:hypothetical protein
MGPRVLLDAVETRENKYRSKLELTYISSPKYHYFAQVSVKIIYSFFTFFFMLFLY